jgi:CheY-like chemotaxis protein
VKNLDTVPLVEANEARLGQLFLNLLLNAAQALPDGDAPHHEVRVSLRSPSPERVLVEIADTGVGIAPDVCERIFEPFFTTKAVGVGTGLGLSICHGIVSSFGGKISVTSEVGKGSVFRVELPIASASTQDDPPSQRQPPPSSRRHRACIAVIDDEPIICSTLKRLLSKEYDVEAFTDARSALERIRGGMRFDVLLCDLMMPEMDGPALYEELRSGDFDQASRVIFLTGGAFTTRAQEFLRSVPNKRLDKPTGIVTLKSILREHLSRTDGEST